MTYDPRKEKRAIGASSSGYAAYMAFCEGQAAAEYGPHMPKRLQRNPYPPGRRHDEYERGAQAQAADQMGAYHGRNV